MFERLARTIVRHRRRVLIVAVLATIVTVPATSGLASRLSGGGFTDPNAPSERAARLLSNRFGQGEPNYTLLVTSPRSQTVNDPSVAAVGARLSRLLSADRGVRQVLSYWSLGHPATLRSRDGHSAVVLALLRGNDSQVKQVAARLTPRLTGTHDGVTVLAGGSAEAYRQMNNTMEQDLRHAEAIAVPLTLLRLLIVFGSVAASLLPLAVGGIAVIATMGILRLLTGVTDVSIFALNLTTALGLGLAIDYSLLIINRYREELEGGAEPHDAVRRTVRTAGRTVVYSALTVIAALSALLVFPIPILRSLGFASIAVVAMSASVAVVVLPAILATLGRRVNAWTLPPFPWLFMRGRPRHDPGVRWGRLARMVMRRPLPVMTVALAVLVILGSPFLGVRFGLTDDRALPATATSRRVGDALRNDFPAREATPLLVVSAERIPSGPLSVYAQRLSELRYVTRVDSAVGSFSDGHTVSVPTAVRMRLAGHDGTRLTVVSSAEPYSAQGVSLTKRVRALHAPAPVLVGGEAAELTDTLSAIQSRLPLAFGVMAGAVLILLFVFTGSVILPIKALVLNLLSLTATFGAMVWVFQDGHLRGLFGNFAVTHMVDVTLVVLMFCVAFGLSMDYEVFMLSRIREEWDRVRDNTRAVSIGLQRSGPIITAAAALMAFVFAAFATSTVTTVKLLGTGLALAVIVDATIVRGLLLPAFMRIAGEANWWAPGPLRRLHARLGHATYVDAGDYGLPLEPAWDQPDASSVPVEDEAVVTGPGGPLQLQEL